MGRRKIIGKKPGNRKNILKNQKRIKQNFQILNSIK